ncbi:unnamed protein product, partial [Discosporangium mesarthrocarpum]
MKMEDPEPPGPCDPNELPCLSRSRRRRLSVEKLWTSAKDRGKFRRANGNMIDSKYQDPVNEIKEINEDGYRDRQWIPPDRARAKEKATEERFMHGKAPLLDTQLGQLSELGLGTVIYFKILKVLAMTFTSMSLIALPSIYINRIGGYMDKVGEKDFFQMLSFTLGNGLFFDSTMVNIGNSTSGGNLSMREAAADLDRTCPMVCTDLKLKIPFFNTALGIGANKV